MFKWLCNHRWQDIENIILENTLLENISYPLYIGIGDILFITKNKTTKYTYSPLYPCKIISREDFINKLNDQLWFARKN